MMITTSYVHNFFHTYVENNSKKQKLRLFMRRKL